MDRLAFQHDDANVALVEVAAPLHCLEQLFVVQVTFAEVPTHQWAGNYFALADLVVGFVRRPRAAADR